MEWGCPWWIFSSDRPTKGEAQVFGWRALSPQSLDQSLKDLELEEEDVVRKIWMSKMGGSEVLGKRNFQESDSGRSNIGGVQPADIIKGSTKRSTRSHGGPYTRSGYLRGALKELGWRSLSKMEAQNLHEGVMVLPISVPMNILLWNCRGALNPRFHVTLNNLIDTRTPSIVIITET